MSHGFLNSLKMMSGFLRCRKSLNCGRSSRTTGSLNRSCCDCRSSLNCLMMNCSCSSWKKACCRSCFWKTNWKSGCSCLKMNWKDGCSCLKNFRVRQTWTGVSQLMSCALLKSCAALPNLCFALPKMMSRVMKKVLQRSRRPNSLTLPALSYHCWQLTKNGWRMRLSGLQMGVLPKLCVLPQSVNSSSIRLKSPLAQRLLAQLVTIILGPGSTIAGQIKSLTEKLEKEEAGATA